MRTSVTALVAGAALAAAVVNAASLSRLNIAVGPHSPVFSNATTLGRSLPVLHRRGSLSVDSPCLFDSDCSTGFCSLGFRVGVYSGQGASKTCQPMPYGGPCSASSDCGTKNCNQGRCDYDQSAAKSCAIPIDCPSGACNYDTCYPAPGETCNPEFGCPATCEPTNTCGKLYDSFFCISDDQCLSGRCSDPINFCGTSVGYDTSTVIRDQQCFDARVCLPPTFGQTCASESIVEQCQTDALTCDSSTTTCTRKPNGANCHYQAQCLSYTCGRHPYNPGRDQKCLALPGGTPCVQDAQCGTGVCSGGTCSVGVGGSECFWNADSARGCYHVVDDNLHYYHYRSGDDDDGTDEHEHFIYQHQHFAQHHGHIHNHDFDHLINCFQDLDDNLHVDHEHQHINTGQHVKLNIHVDDNDVEAGANQYVHIRIRILIDIGDFQVGVKYFNNDEHGDDEQAFQHQHNDHVLPHNFQADVGRFILFHNDLQADVDRHADFDHDEADKYISINFYHEQVQHHQLLHCDHL
ncbi:hypothetical protein OC844_003617 [Tilletia horrida]|nr:hypothetical protein OC844_003617 [Tilletia horrida]